MGKFKKKILILSIIFLWERHKHLQEKKAFSIEENWPKSLKNQEKPHKSKPQVSKIRTILKKHKLSFRIDHLLYLLFFWWSRLCLFKRHFPLQTIERSYFCEKQLHFFLLFHSSWLHFLYLLLLLRVNLIFNWFIYLVITPFISYIILVLYKIFEALELDIIGLVWRRRKFKRDIKSMMRIVFIQFIK